MILAKQTEAIILEEGQVPQETIKMELDLDSSQILMQMLSKNLYSDSIGSTIRECASNALDSHRKANVDKPIVVSFQVNEQNNYEFSVEDFGIGLDADDVRNIISKYGKSTKRQDSNALGMMGLGFKAPLAYASSFYFICRKAGVECKYMMYEGEEDNTIDFLYEKETRECNGVKVIVPVNYSDAATFVKKIKEQLCYFESVFFNVPARSINYYSSIPGVENDFIIFRHNLFQFSELNQDTKMHICLDNVYYPMDFAKLGIPALDFPIALRFGLSDGLYPTPNRESLRYTKEAIEIIHQRLVQVADYFTIKYNESLDVDSDVFSIMEYYNTSSRTVVVSGDKKYDLKELHKYSTVSYVVPALDGIKLLDLSRVFTTNKESLLGEYSLRYKLKDGRISDRYNKGYDYDFKVDKLDKGKLVVYHYEDRLPGIKKDYIKAIAQNGVAYCFVRRENKRRLGISTVFGNSDYIHLLNLENHPINEWRAKINEWKYIVSLITKDFIDLDKMDIPQEYLDSRKKTKVLLANGQIETKRIRLKGEVRGKQAMDLERHNGSRSCKFVPDSFAIEKFENYKGLTIYALHEDYLKLDQLYGFSSKQKMRLLTFSDREMKVLEKAEIHNLMTFDKFMEGKNAPFKRLVTAFLINKLMVEYRNVFDRLDIFSFISTDFHQKIFKIRDFKKNNYVKESSEVYTAMLAVAEEHNLYDMNIYPEYLEMKELLEYLDFLEPLTAELGYAVKSDSPIIKVFVSLFKYYRYKVNLCYYLAPKEEEVEEEVID